MKWSWVEGYDLVGVFVPVCIGETLSGLGRNLYDRDEVARDAPTADMMKVCPQRTIMYWPICSHRKSSSTRVTGSFVPPMLPSKRVICPSHHSSCTHTVIAQQHLHTPILLERSNTRTPNRQERWRVDKTDKNETLILTLERSRLGHS